MDKQLQDYLSAYFGKTINEQDEIVESQKESVTPIGEEDDLPF